MFPLLLDDYQMPLDKRQLKQKRRLLSQGYKPPRSENLSLWWLLHLAASGLGSASLLSNTRRASAGHVPVDLSDEEGYRVSQKSELLASVKLADLY